MVIHNNPSTSTVEGLLACKTGRPRPISIQYMYNYPDNNQKKKNNNQNQKHDFIIFRVR